MTMFEIASHIGGETPENPAREALRQAELTGRLCPISPPRSYYAGSRNSRNKRLGVIASGHQKMGVTNHAANAHNTSVKGMAIVMPRAADAPG